MNTAILVSLFLDSGPPTLLMLALVSKRHRAQALRLCRRIAAVEALVFLVVCLAVFFTPGGPLGQLRAMESGVEAAPREVVPTEDVSPPPAPPPVEETAEAQARREALHAGYVAGKGLASGPVQRRARPPGRAALDAIVRVRSAGKPAAYAEGFRLGFTAGLELRPQQPEGDTLEP